MGRHRRRYQEVGLHAAPLTGHIGERVNRQVALVTDDFRLYHELAPFLEAQGVQLLGLAPGQAVPISVQVLLDGPADDERSVPVRATPEATWLAVLAALDDRPTARGGYRRVVVGVDPGATIGLAVLADGALLWVAECHGPEDAVQRIMEWRDGLEPDAWEVHVGDGSPQEGRAILGALRQRMPDMDTRLVREEASTPLSPITASRHTDAAMRIALRKPGE